jgi:7-carboxy-7-deazaguanine synthase
VVEIFGPTIQGEGPDAGRPAHFVRFGGCEFRCTWCDSLHAVEPAQLRTHAEKLTDDDVLQRVRALPSGPSLVVLSGGNPALLDLGRLVASLHAARLDVAVETQGSRWRPWLAAVDRLVVSPKPPSSGMATSHNALNFEAFMEQASERARPGACVLKVVVFDERDLDWATALHARRPRVPLFLSPGTDVGLDEQQTLVRLRRRFAWLAEAVARREGLNDVRVTPQLHVIAWGPVRGV